ncbi:MAG: 2Fe-2S iron-sulfur cluster binding domain-containing protein [Flavobacteriaceae bacterium]|nr:MAG: 2Fe-2S iron-sulfur cluster binding domain-containing protein [Flavobacteriaceae bacterium]
MQTLLINGKSYEVDVPSTHMPLLWALRDLVGLTGTKFGCGVAQCGACSVMVDGILVKSCSMPLSFAIGKEVMTIEHTTPTMALVRQAWKELNVPQCGYCQPGQIMAATALLDANESPSDEDIDVVMSGNICRCGTYIRIKKAIHEAVKLRKQTQ